ncbi:MAG: RNA polymerase sigma factor [Planctomycetes bacterium]|nr:RNA polymerase sigma factor [Planctomycetota bacterium]
MQGLPGATSRNRQHPDTSGIERCFDRHAGWLLLYARSLPFDDPEAAVQEAFLNLWGRLEAGAVIEDAASYLAAIVRNAATREIGRNRLRLTSVSETDWFTRQKASHDAVSPKAVQTAVQALPDDQRDVVILKIWGGLTFEQIAWALGIPMNTAASRYRYALQRLKRLLEGDLTATRSTPPGVLNNDQG